MDDHERTPASSSDIDACEIDACEIEACETETGETEANETDTGDDIAAQPVADRVVRDDVGAVPTTRCDGGPIDRSEMCESPAPADSDGGCGARPQSSTRAAESAQSETDRAVTGCRRPDDRDRPRRGRSWDGPSTGLELSPAPAVAKGRDLWAEWNELKQKRLGLLRSLEQKSLELAQYRDGVTRAEEARLRRKADREKQKMLERIQRDLARQESERLEHEQQERDRRELERQERERQKREQQQKLMRQERARQKREERRVREQHEQRARSERARQKQDQREPARCQGQTEQEERTWKKNEQQERVLQELAQLERARCRNARGTQDRLSAAEVSPSDDDCSGTGDGDEEQEEEEEEYDWGQADEPSRVTLAHRPPVRQQLQKWSECKPPPSVSSGSFDAGGCEYYENSDADDNREPQEDYCY